MSTAQAVTFRGPAGDLEGLLEAPQTPRAVALVCHPHPQHEGTMYNKVAHTLARAMTDVDCAALRFNFRGVGASAGSYGEGVGEVADALAAAQWLQNEFPGLPLYLAGFSFGARVAMLAASTLQCDALVTVAPAVRLEFALDFVQPTAPWLVVQGDADELVASDDVIDWVNGLKPGPRLIVMDGVGHFFHGQLTPLRKHVAAFISELADAS